MTSGVKSIQKSVQKSGQTIINQIEEAESEIHELLGLNIDIMEKIKNK